MSSPTTTSASARSGAGYTLAVESRPLPDRVVPVQAVADPADTTACSNGQGLEGPVGT
jgi:hypothetical protein